MTTTQTALKVEALDDWILPVEKIELFLEGRLLVLPPKLVEAVESAREGGGRRWSIEKKECAYLMWHTIYSTRKSNANRRYVRLMNDHLLFGSSTKTAGDAKSWLIDKGFLRINNSYSTGYEGRGGFPKGYRAIRSKGVEVVELEKKSLFDCWTQPRHRLPDRFCEYTRDVLDQLEYDHEDLVAGIQSTIAQYKKKVKAREKESNKREKNQAIEDAEDALLKLGKPLFELVHKRGSISRSVKEHGHRLFSPFGFLMTEFRPLFKLCGERLAFIDAVESQPNLLGNLSDDKRLIEDCNAYDFERGEYGEFYDRIAKHFDLRDENGEVSRKMGKKPFYQYAFAGYRPNFSLTPYMAERYGNADAWMRDNKRGNHRKASWLLQGYESSIFIDGIYAGLIKKNIPSLSIHDCIVCPESYGEQVEEIVKGEFANRDITAKVKREVLKPDFTETL